MEDSLQTLTKKVGKLQDELSKERDRNAAAIQVIALNLIESPACLAPNAATETDSARHRSVAFGKIPGNGGQTGQRSSKSTSPAKGRNGQVQTRVSPRLRHNTRLDHQHETGHGWKAPATGRATQEGNWPNSKISCADLSFHKWNFVHKGGIATQHNITFLLVLRAESITADRLRAQLVRFAWS